MTDKGHIEGFFIDTGYAYAGVIARDGIIVRTAPIFSWMIGKPCKQVFKWRKIVAVGPFFTSVP